MKSFMISILFLLLLSTVAFPFDRMVLGELFANHACPYCVTANQFLDELYPDISDHTALIRYHVWWPASDDPFYEYNPEQNRERTTYYAVSAVPAFVIDGEVVDAPYGQWDDSLDARAEVSSPIAIEIDTSIFGEVTIRIDTRDLTESMGGKLFVVITEDSIHHIAPNGETMFQQIMRKMIPSDGEAMTLHPGATVEKNFDIPIDPVWDLEQCNIVAFFQIFSCEVLQSAVVRFPHRPEYFVSLSADSGKKSMASPHSVVNFRMTLSNTGTESDIYSFWHDDTGLPDGWSAQLSWVSGVFDSTDIFLSSTEGVNISLNVNVGDGGIGYVDVNAASNTVADVRQSIRFIVISDVELLLVDNSKDIAGEELILSDLNELLGNVAYWNTSSDGQITDINDIDIGSLVWYSGKDTSTALLYDDIEQLSDYLSDGGGLLIAGNGFGRSIGSNAFYVLKMKSVYLGSSDSYSSVSGVGPLAGFSADLLPTNVEMIRPLSDSAVVVLRYDDGESCAGIYFKNGYKLAYLPFDPVDIADTDARRELLGILLGRLPVKDIDKPRIVSLDAYPNPFNSELNIYLDAPGCSSVEIYNTLGEKVAELMLTSYDAPATVRWKPDDLPSGVYLLRASLKKYPIYRKIVLLK